MTASSTPDPASRPDPAAVDPALQRAFVFAVLEANGLLLAVALGVLFALVGRIHLGAVLLAVGAVLTADCWRRVRAVQSDRS